MLVPSNSIHFSIFLRTLQTMAEFNNKGFIRINIVNSRNKNKIKRNNNNNNYNKKKRNNNNNNYNEIKRNNNNNNYNEIDRSGKLCHHLNIT